MTFGERLRRELEKRKMSVKRFQETLHEKKVRGSAYSSVWSWLNDDKNPPLEFIRAAAKLLGVREQWLETGDGPRTELEAKTIEAAAPEEDTFRAAFQALGRAEKRMRAPFRISDLNMLNHGIWVQLAIRLLEQGPDRQFEDHNEDQMLHALEPFAWLLALPWIAVRHMNRVDPTADPMPQDIVNTYFMGMYQALNVAMPQPGEGDTEASIRFLHFFKDALTESLWAEQKRADEGGGDDA